MQSADDALAKLQTPHFRRFLACRTIEHVEVLIEEAMRSGTLNEAPWLRWILTAPNHGHWLWSINTEAAAAERDRSLPRDQQERMVGLLVKILKGGVDPVQFDARSPYARSVLGDLIWFRALDAARRLELVALSLDLGHNPTFRPCHLYYFDEAHWSVHVVQPSGIRRRRQRRYAGWYVGESALHVALGQEPRFFDLLRSRATAQELEDAYYVRAMLRTEAEFFGSTVLNAGADLNRKAHEVGNRAGALVHFLCTDMRCTSDTFDAVLGRLDVNLPVDSVGFYAAGHIWSSVVVFEPDALPLDLVDGQIALLDHEEQTRRAGPAFHADRLRRHRQLALCKRESLVSRGARRASRTRGGRTSGP